MKIHELRIWPKYLKSIVEKTKKWELRNSDARIFEKGDYLHLVCYCPDAQASIDIEHEDGHHYNSALCKVDKVYRNLPIIDPSLVVMDITLVDFG